MVRRASLRKWLLFASSLAAPARFATLAKADEQPAATAARQAVWVDVANTAPFAFETAAHEARSLLREAGVEVILTRVAPGTARRDELAVVLLPSVARGALAGRWAMGATAREPASPSVWVFLPAVAATLDLDLAAIKAWTPRQRADFSLAVGRVVAHEVVHLLVPGLPHAGHGLMARRMNRFELLSPGLRIDAASARALRGTVEASSSGVGGLSSP